MKTKVHLVTGAVLAVAFAVPVHADDDTGGYFGVSANRLSADQQDVNDVDFDDSDTALGVKLGYMFNNSFGIEGGYLDLGNYETEGNQAGRNLSLDAEGWYAAIVLNTNLGDNWDLYAKLGALAFDSDTDFGDFDESSTEAYGGVGIEYDFGGLNLFGEFSVIDTDVNDLTIDIITLGLKYEFR